MGWGKYFEDNEKIRDDRNYKGRFSDPNIPKKVLYDCCYCDKLFDSSKKRNDHIKERHNVVGPLLFINEKIASEENYVEKITTMKIALFGHNEVSISVNGQSICNQSPISDENFIDVISSIDDKENKYEIKIGNKTFKIHKYQSIKISSEKVGEIISEWEIQMSNNKELERNYSKEFNEAEKKYLDGFFEYFIGSRITEDLNNKTKRYETAFSILSSFNDLTPKARFLLKVISFKFNWIQTLEHLSNESKSKGIFDVILDFYYGRKSEINQNKNGNKKQLYVEDEIEDYLNIIFAYQKNEKDIVKLFPVEWTEDAIDTIQDINKKDRIFFLKTRIEKNNNYFNNIKTPILRKLAEKEKNINN